MNVPSYRRRAWRAVASICASLALLCAWTPAAALPGDSVAQSKSSDSMRTWSGWKFGVEDFGSEPPTGNFTTEYKHWFNGAEPAAWTLRGNPPKPAKEDWTTTDPHTDDLTTTSASGKSTAYSEWKISTYRRGGRYKASYETRSIANANAPDTTAGAKTRARDPWTLNAPSLDPHWPGYPLDPDGHWTVGLESVLLGSLNTKDGTTELGVAYRAAFNSADPRAAHDLLSINITGLGATVTADADLRLFIDGVMKSPAEVALVLDAYLTPTGWFLDPSFDLVNYDSDNPAHRAQVFHLDAVLFLDDDTVQSVTVFTEAYSGALATAAVPEPSTGLMLVAGSMLMIAVVRRRKARGAAGAASPRAAASCRLAAPAAAVALLASASVSAAGPNLITNGSFEANNHFIERAGFPRLDDVNGSAPTGWTRDSSDLAEYMTRMPEYLGVTIYNPADGDFFIGPHDGEWWEQTFATVAGTSYTLTYSSAYGAAWWSSFYYRPGVSPGTVSLTGSTTLFSGALAGTAAAPTGTTLLDSPFVWSQHTATFVADSAFTRLRFAGSSVPDGGYVFVDDVSVRAVSAVPEPGVAWLLLVGAPLLVLARKRSSACI